MEIIITKIILGINDDIVSPYKEEMSNCFRLGLISSNVVLSTIIAVIKPTEKTQNRLFMVVFKKLELMSVVIDFSQ